jgi:predicted transcriptional regulator
MTLTVRPDLEIKLAAIAGQRDPQAMLDEAVEGYIDEEGEFLAAVTEGRKSIAHGEGILHSEVMSEIDAIIAAAEERLRADRCE